MSVRGLTVTAGAAAGLAGLLALTLIGGLELASEAPRMDPQPNRAGPLTAVQPDLRQALLSEADLSDPRPPAPATATARPAPRAEPPVRASASQPAHPAGGRQPEAHNACGSLLAHPGPLWGATPPRESISARTLRPQDAALHQVLAVFDEPDAPAAFRRLREAIAGCDEFPATLHGETVTVLLHSGSHFSDIGWDAGREESAEVTPTHSPARSSTHSPTQPPTHAPTPTPAPTGAHSATPTPTLAPSPSPPTATSPLPVPSPTWTEEAGFVTADEAYALELTVHTSSGTLTGWLALDRVGPAISVLRRLGPQACSRTEALEIRRVALTKLRDLVDGLR